MAGSVKSVSVVFQAFTDKFEKKVDKAGKSMGGFAKKALGFAAGFVAARATLSGFTGAMDKLNQLGKISKTLDVSPDFLKGLDLAAADVGESFEKAQDIVKEFNIRMGEAKTGAGPAVNGLELIGKTLKDFEGLNPEQSFLKVAEAISKIEDKQKKIFIAGEFFGGAGEDMLALLDQGEAGLRRFIEEARRLGGPISEEDLKRAQAANLAIKKVGMAMDGVFQKVAMKLAPTIESIVNDGLEPFLELTDKIGASWNNTAAWVQKVADAIHGIEDPFKEQKPGTFLKNALDQANEKIASDSIKKSAAAIVQPTRGFAESISFQSSRAFDILNPAKPNSMAGKNAAANEKTAKATTQIVKILGKKTTVTVIPGG
tara:strand:- start:281 stop:1396 length:1116 start_codon:yes stop_codon:yes gene_type:complete